MSFGDPKYVSPIGNMAGNLSVEGSSYRPSFDLAQRESAMSNPRQQYPDANVRSFEMHESALQQSMINEARPGSYGITVQPGQGGMSPPSSEQFRTYENNDYANPALNQSSTTQYGENIYHQRSSQDPNFARSYAPQLASTLQTDLSQTHAQQPGAMYQRDLSQTFSPVSRKAVPHAPIPNRGQDFQNPSIMSRDLGIRHASSASQGSASPYIPPGDTVYTPDRSVIGSPLPQMTPDSLQHELDRTRNRCEEILTKLIETQTALSEKERENAQLRTQLAQQARGPSWELDGLRRQVWEYSEALKKAQEQTVHYHGQAEGWARECTRLRESQNQNQNQQPTRTDPAQVEDFRKTTEFYKQKIDQLSRENTNIGQQNRKLTDDLATAQRDAQQQRTRVR